MASHATAKPLDVQKLVSGAAKLELKLLNAGVDALQVYINQAARLSSLASETLQAIQDDKATLAETTSKLTDFGRQSLQAYAELTQRLGTSYFKEIDRLAGSSLASKDVPEATRAAAAGPAVASLRAKARRTRAVRA